MREVVVVSTARTPIGKAYRGAFNATQPQSLGGHAISAAVSRAKVEGAEVDDVVIGAAWQQGATGFNIARQAALAARLPTNVPGMSIDRQCASGLIAIATAANNIRTEGHTIAVAGGWNQYRWFRINMQTATVRVIQISRHVYLHYT